MKSIVIILITTLVLALAMFMYYRYSRTEGFALEKEKEVVNNALVNVMSQLKRMTGTMTNPKLWAERMEFISMSPVELARHYIKNQSKKQKE